MTRNDEASFTFSWLALKLLGRGLYSNPWSALSELVANGLDAEATDVHVYMDARDKSNAIVEVIDNGSGMSRTDIDNYVKVGHDKRKDLSAIDLARTNPKGRKGIGKLAALFLSPHFFLSTRHAEGGTAWELDAREGKVKDDEHPRLQAVERTPTTPNDALWMGLGTGTRLTMLGVDLTGYGTQAILALGRQLANQFLLPVNSSPRIFLWVRDNSDAQPGYEPVSKSIAFFNLSEVAQNFPDTSIRPDELSTALPPVQIPAKGLSNGRHEHTPALGPLAVAPEQDEAWEEISEDVDLNQRTYRGVPFALTGWIGIHATINGKVARENDTRFTKNKYYNPAEIRVYVRGKLASDRLLSQLGLTGTYVNYIEGEITFDLLDDNSLPDIATSNRQDFDETDKRVLLLRALVRPAVQGLIQRRNILANQINAAALVEKQRRETASKKHFVEQLRNDLQHHTEIPESTRDELHMVISNKIQGDVTPKQSFRVFISHAKIDKSFAALIDGLLQDRGARKEEIFFTSRTGSTEVLRDDRALGEVVKRNITDDNTLIFYLTSKNFLASQFCLFEGGAGWATRGVSEYLKLNVTYDSIPSWLTNGRGEATLLGADKKIQLTAELHNYLIDGVLNPMIAHLNRGRDIAGEPLMEAFQSADFPIDADMHAAGKTPADYFDAKIADHWSAVVESEIVSYVERYFELSTERKRILDLERDNVRLQALLDAS
jgi:hypothetical protein